MIEQYSPPALTLLTEPGAIQSGSLTFADGSSATLGFDFRSLNVHIGIFQPEVAETVLEFTGIESQLRARHALEVILNKADALAQTRGELGSMSSRLAVAHSSAVASREIAALAESRIRDADIADESSKLVRLNILQQAAAAALAQANQQPALALQLLS